MESTDTPQESRLLLFKYGGNAMRNLDLQKAVIEELCALRAKGVQIVIVHGGGPFIKSILATAKVESQFVGGHRVTTPEALTYVKMALKGQVNTDLVNLINTTGQKAVGLSGIDGAMVRARKRWHLDPDGNRHDLGQVGDVDQVDPALIQKLLKDGFIPVVTCLAADQDGQEYNINGDMFAGHLAGALDASEYIVLTDVDGLMADIQDPGSLFNRLSVADLDRLRAEGVIKGGMLPKMESCEVALAQGAQRARIINGTQPELIQQLAQNSNQLGTLIEA
jgi:acetylglutamate kinase